MQTGTKTPRRRHNEELNDPSSEPDGIGLGVNPPRREFAEELAGAHACCGNDKSRATSFGLIA